MSSSYGDAYATRSDDEGFGGIYGGNKEDEENIKHGKAPGINFTLLNIICF